METSAKNNVNINESFYYLAKEIKDKRMIADQPSESIVISQRDPANKPKANKSCCSK
jgi:hypothetical protein